MKEKLNFDEIFVALIVLASVGYAAYELVTVGLTAVFTNPVLMLTAGIVIYRVMDKK